MNMSLSGIRFPRRFAASVFCAALLIHAPAALGQTAVVIPDCGKVGDTVRICGSGWSEPSPVCDYFFFFDGTEVASPQADGLFGPPNTSFTVPEKETGAYQVLVELRLRNDDGSLGGKLVGSDTVTFNVVDTDEEPLTAALTQSNGRITLTYDPDKDCEGNCDAIYFIQTRQTLRVLNDGTEEHLPYNEAPHNWANGDAIEATFVNGVAIDRIFGKAVPYYGIPPGAAQAGSKVEIGPTLPAIMGDRPRRSDASYAANVAAIKINFVVHVFCGAGDAAGSYFGKITWTWTRLKGAMAGGSPYLLGTITVGAASDDEPDQTFLDALNKWIEKNPAFKLPTTSFPGCN